MSSEQLVIAGVSVLGVGASRRHALKVKQAVKDKYQGEDTRAKPGSVHVAWRMPQEKYQQLREDVESGELARLLQGIFGDLEIKEVRLIAEGAEILHDFETWEPLQEEHATSSATKVGTRRRNIRHASAPSSVKQEIWHTVKQATFEWKRIIITWSLNLFYLFLYIVTFGKTFHEGRFFKFVNIWVNWNQTFFSKPATFATPSSEDSIRDLVRNAKKVRVVGAGHSFNSGNITDDVVISLDKYNKILDIDHKEMTVTAQAGIRLRDFMEQIGREQPPMSLPTLGSTNAQSLGGLVASDLHGSAKKLGFLSDQILALKIVDGKGEVRILQRGDEDFHAVPGAIGTLGVVIEVTIQCVPYYYLDKKISVVERQDAELNIAQNLQKHDHLSYYYISGAAIESCRQNDWNVSEEGPSSFANFLKFKQEIVDFIMSGFMLGLSRVLNAVAIGSDIGNLIMKLCMSQGLTMDAGASFSRQLYYRHIEIEYGFPLENYVEILHELLAVLEAGKHVSVVETRFILNGSSSLIGPGADRPTVFLEVNPSLSVDPVPMYTAAEAVFKKHGGYPHLGKWTRVDRAYMQKVHGPRFTKFLDIRRKYDPENKFMNDFTKQLFE